MVKQDMYGTAKYVQQDIYGTAKYVHGTARHVCAAVDQHRNGLPVPYQNLIFHGTFM